MEPDYLGIPNRIQYAMLRSGMSQRSLSKEMHHKSSGLVHNWVHGYEYPGATSIAALCSALGITPNQLFGMEET